MAAKSGRTIQFEKKTSLRSVLAMRETMLLLLFLYQTFKFFYF